MEFSAKGASGQQCNCHSPLFRFFFHVSGVVLIIVHCVICPFHGQYRVDNTALAFKWSVVTSAVSSKVSICVYELVYLPKQHS